MAIITYVENFDGGEPGEGIAPHNSIFDQGVASHPARFAAGVGRSGSQGAIAEPYGLYPGTSSLMTFVAADTDPRVPAPSATSVREFYDVAQWSGAFGDLGSYEDFLAFAISEYGSEEAATEALAAFPPARWRLVGVDAWFRYASEAAWIIDELPPVYTFPIILQAVGTGFRDIPGESIYPGRVGMNTINPDGSSGENLAIPVDLDVDQWYRFTGEETPPQRSTGTSTLQLEGGPAVAGNVRFGAYAHMASHHFSPGDATFYPLVVDSFVVMIETYEALTDIPPVRLYPREDGRGMSCAPRLWPPSKARRVYGGHR